MLPVTLGKIYLNNAFFVRTRKKALFNFDLTIEPGVWPPQVFMCLLPISMPKYTLKSCICAHMHVYKCVHACVYVIYMNVCKR